MGQAQEIREEVLRSVSAAETEAFLTGVIRSAGSVNLRRNGVELVIATEKKDIADAVKPMLLKSGVLSFASSSKEDGTKGAKYLVTVSVGDSDKLLRKLGILKDECLLLQGFDPERPIGGEEILGFFKGLFTTGGSASLTDGEERQGYHLEITLTNETLATEIVTILADLGLDKWHVIERKYNIGVYLKDREQISDFLVLIGATKSALELQSAIALKELRNNLNRQNNVASANLDKTVTASQDVIRDVLYLKETGRLDSLSDALVRTAELRVDNPESSLSELAALGGCTKSGLTHRLKKIQQIAQQLRKNGRTL